MPEIGTSGSMSGDGKRGVAEWPKLPRPSSTLPSRRFGPAAICLELGVKPTCQDGPTDAFDPNQTSVGAPVSFPKKAALSHTARTKQTSFVAPLTTSTRSLEVPSPQIFQSRQLEPRWQS